MEWPHEPQPMPLPQTLVVAANVAEEVQQLARKPEPRQGFPRQQPPPMKVKIPEKSFHDLCNIQPRDMGGFLILMKLRKNEKVLF